MKKLLLNYKLILSAAFLSIIVIACGSKFVSIALNKNNPMQGQQITATAKLEVASTENNNTDPRYQLFAIRVPADWTGVSVSATVDEATGVAINLNPCEGYAKFCEFCFPRDGYKWIAYQTEGKISQGDKSKAVAKIKAGNALGEYELDFLAGAFDKDPSVLLDNGNINLSIAFGHNTDDTKFTPDPQVNTEYFNSSEYLLIASTLSEEEYTARQAAVKAEYTATVTVNDGKTTETRPLNIDIANPTPIVTKVTVIADPSGIEEIKNDLSDSVEYYNLQGIRVENPENGLFIRRQGNKTTKVFVK